jgi:hypothetical protein
MSATLMNGPNLAYAHEKLTGLAAAKGTTLAVYTVPLANGSDAYASYARPVEALVTVETADIRWTCDGTTPTVTAGTALGHITAAGDSFNLVGFQNIQQFKAINAVNGNGATLRITYFR